MLLRRDPIYTLPGKASPRLYRRVRNKRGESVFCFFLVLNALAASWLAAAAAAAAAAAGPLKLL